MKLNGTQIEKLYSFVRQHYVEYYDVQSELVDHLANAIEWAQAENKQLSFEAALQIEFKKFGVFGFMEIVEQRQHALNKKYIKLVWKHFLGFFKLPQIAVLFSGFFIVYKGLGMLRHSEEIFLTLFGTITVGLFIKLLTEKFKRSQHKNPAGKRWLLEETIYNCGSLTSFLILPIQFITLFSNHSVAFFESKPILIISSLILVIYAAFVYIAIILLPSKAQQYLKETYPEYEFEEV